MIMHLCDNAVFTGYAISLFEDVAPNENLFLVNAEENKLHPSIAAQSGRVIVARGGLQNIPSTWPSFPAANL